MQTVFWLTAWIKSGLIHLTLSDLLEMEDTYPHLIGDIDRVIWQIELIKAQVEDGK